MDEHRGAFEYDWRTRFQLPLEDVPADMSWGEAWRLFNILALDPASQVAAGLAGWIHPAERADLVMRDLFDLEFRKVKKNPKAYPRPWDKETERRLAVGNGLSIADFRAAIGPQIESEQESLGREESR